MLNGKRIDAKVLAAYGIIQPALPEDAHLEARYGVRSQDHKGIINAMKPLQLLTPLERRDLYDLARCMCEM